MNRHLRISFLAAAGILLAATVLANPNVPKPDQDGALVLRGATVHTVAGPALADAWIHVEDGRVIAVGSGAAPSIGGATIVEIAGLHVYPGLISANTVLGLVEIEAVRATVDVAEPGSINPNVRAEVAVNPDSENIPVARANGVLAALTTPLAGSGLIAGQSALIQLDGWTWEDMTIRAPVGLHISLPALRVPDELEGPQRQRFIERRDEQLDLLQTSFEDALAYRRARAAGTIEVVDRRWEAMLPVFEHELPIFAHADELSQIRYALRLAEEFDFDLVIVGGADAWRMADVLAAREVPVIVSGIHRPPQRRWEGYAMPSELPRKLLEAGVEVAIANAGGTFAAPMERHLAYEAAEAVAFGLDPDEAIRMLTLYPARILGVDDRLGSIEDGKDATFIVTDGNPLDIRTRVLRAFVQGREIDLSSRHTVLNAKYSERLDQLGVPE